MLSRQVAIVSQTERAPFSQVAKVSAAIQKQVSRDLTRYWSIDATVDAFEKLSDVPLGYWQVIIRDSIPFDAQGIHLNRRNGQPYALVAYSDEWSLTVSHESLEMLVDPSGNRVAAGNSIKSGQGRVQYVVEVCDPCEDTEFAYTVNGIVVSDFYTPAFFDPVGGAGKVYSFNGSIQQPRQVLNGGYLSWIDPKDNHLWQVFVQNNKAEYVDQGDITGGFSTLRELCDIKSAEFRKSALLGTPSKKLLRASMSAGGRPGVVDEATEAEAKYLEAEIERVIARPAKG